MGRPTLTTHRKFRRLARALGTPILARGALELLWDHCYESGDPYLGTAEDLEQLVGWTGDRGALTQALVEAGRPEGTGFVEPSDRTPDGVLTYQVHDLWHHAPEYVSKRQKRENERRQRGSARRTADADRKVTAALQTLTAERQHSADTDRTLTVERRHTADTDRQTADTDRRPAENGGTPSPSPSPSPTPAPAPARPAAIAARPRPFGRLHLHRWQLDELLAMLGPHAEAFDLDRWLFTLSGGDYVLPAPRDVWPWVLDQLRAEVRRRGLPVAEVAPPVSRHEAQIAATLAHFKGR